MKKQIINLNELFIWLKDEEDKELVALIGKEAKDLIKTHGVNLDLKFEERIRIMRHN